MSRPEKTGIRDLRFNDWHRLLPSDFYAADSDFDLYDENEEWLASYELKHGNQKEKLDLHKPGFSSLRANMKKATKAGVPFFLVLYYPNKPRIDAPQSNDYFKHWQFYVVGLNEEAKKILPTERQMSELTFVKLRHYLRKKKFYPLVQKFDETVIEIDLPVIVT